MANSLIPTLGQSKYKFSEKSVATRPGAKGLPSMRIGSGRNWASPAVLGALIISAATLYFLASVARYQSFYSGNWDLGINMQMLWSTTHGRLLYEAGDFEVQGTNSYLLIHTTYVALPISYLYALAPGAEVLFALQAAVLSLSAVPLYFIGRRSGVGPALLLAGIAAYLISFPVVSGFLFDFHWEAFLPLEFLLTYYFWTGRRFLVAMVPAVLGCLTLEVFPLLLLGLVLYGAYPWLEVLARRPSEAIRVLRRSWPSARPWVGLAVFVVVSYMALRFSEHDLVGPIVGYPAGSYSTQVSDALATLFSWGASWSTIESVLVYWALLLAAFGLVPLLARQRLLLLNVPWFLAGIVEYPTLADAFGNQYALVAISPFAIGFIEGLGILSARSAPPPARTIHGVEWLPLLAPFAVVLIVASSQLLGPTPNGVLLVAVVSSVTLAVYLALRLVRRRLAKRSIVVASTSRSASERPHFPRVRRAAGPVAMGAALTVLVAANLAMSPLNPANFGASNQPAYSYSWSSNPAFDYIQDIVTMIPAGAVVVATNDLFPFVANDNHAYSLSWWSAPLPYLPFSASSLPQYVFASTSQLPLAPAYLEQAVSNRSQYGVDGLIYYTGHPGSIYLYKLGFTGNTTVWLAVPSENPIVLCPVDLVPGRSGQVVPAPGTRCGSEITSVPAQNLSGSGPCIWYGPYITLLPGSYNATIALEGTPNPGIPPSQILLTMNANGFGMSTYWYSVGLSGTQLNSSQWTDFVYHFVVSQPIDQAEFRGYLTVHGELTPANVSGRINLEYIEIQRT